MAKPRVASPHLLYLILCDSVEPSNGKKNFLGTFDRISASEFPCIFRRFSIVTGWEGFEGDYVMNVEIEDPDGKQIFSSPPLGLRFQRPLCRADFIIEVEGLKLDRPGIYQVQILLKNKRVSFYKVSVEKIQKAG